MVLSDPIYRLLVGSICERLRMMKGRRGWCQVEREVELVSSFLCIHGLFYVCSFDENVFKDVPDSIQEYFIVQLLGLKSSQFLSITADSYHW